MYQLCAVAIISLDKHNLLRDLKTLRRCTEPENRAETRVCFLVTMSNAHTTTRSDIESLKATVFADDSDETNIVREDIHIVCWRHCDSDLELKVPVSTGNGELHTRN